MDTIGTRIKRLRKDKKLTLKDLGSKVGVSDVAVSHWEKDVNVPKLEHLNFLAHSLDSTIDFIMYGKKTDESIKDFRPITRMLPVLTFVQCGAMTTCRSISTHEVEEWLPAPQHASKEAFYMIVQGSSNEPEFYDGDYICIDPSIPLESVQHGEMIVVVQNDEATFKALVREPYSLHLKALNPAFTPNIIPLQEEFIYKGAYIGKFTPKKKFL